MTSLSSTLLCLVISMAPNKTYACSYTLNVCFTHCVVGEVQNLTAILQPNYEFGSGTFLTLQWDAPIKNSDDEVTSYDIRFKPKDGDDYHEESVDGPSKTITLTKASGIEPLTTYKFKVRARIGDTEGKWKAVSQYIGRCRIARLISKMLLYLKKQGQGYQYNIIMLILSACLTLVSIVTTGGDFFLIC